jgi:hypothetical protein
MLDIKYQISNKNLISDCLIVHMLLMHHNPIQSMDLNDRLIEQLHSSRIQNISLLLEQLSDDTIPTLEWIYSVMRIQTRDLCIDCLDGSTNSLPIIQIVLILNKTYQMIALENVYQASLTYGFSFLFPRFTLPVNYYTVHLFQWWFDRFGFECAVFNGIIGNLMIRGHTKTLQWFVDTYYSLDMRFEYVLRLSREPIKVLNWLWSQHLLGKLVFAYDDTMLTTYVNQYNLASCDTLIEVLNWFYSIKEEIAFKYDVNLFNIVRHDGFVLVLQWFYDRKHEIELKYTSECVDNASQYGVIDVMEFFYNLRYEIEFKYTCKAMDESTVHSHIWWFDHADTIELKYTNNICIDASRTRLDFLYAKHLEGFEFKHEPRLLNLCYYFDTDALDWFIEHDYPLILDYDTINRWVLCSEGPDPSYLQIKQWCIKNLDKLIFTEDREVMERGLNQINDE